MFFRSDFPSGFQITAGRILKIVDHVAMVGCTGSGVPYLKRMCQLRRTFEEADGDAFIRPLREYDADLRGILNENMLATL